MKNILITLLICFIVYLGAHLVFTQRIAVKLDAQAAILPAETLRQITINKKQVKHTYRTEQKTNTMLLPSAAGEAKATALVPIAAGATLAHGTSSTVVQQNFYLPPEGSLISTQKADGGFKLDIKNKGFCFAPFAGGVLDITGAAQLYIGARLVYYNRYGLGVAFGGTKPLFVFDRRLDDVVPLLGNSALGLLGGYKYLGVGFSIYF